MNLRGCLFCVFVKHHFKQGEIMKVLRTLNCMIFLLITSSLGFASDFKTRYAIGESTIYSLKGEAIKTSAVLAKWEQLEGTKLFKETLIHLGLGKRSQMETTFPVNGGQAVISRSGQEKIYGEVHVFANVWNGWSFKVPHPSGHIIRGSEGFSGDQFSTFKEVLTPAGEKKSYSNGQYNLIDQKTYEIFLSHFINR